MPRPRCVGWAPEFMGREVRLLQCQVQGMRLICVLLMVQANARSAAAAAAAQPEEAATSAAAGQAAAADAGKQASAAGEQQDQARPPSPQIEKPIEVRAARLSASLRACFALPAVFSHGFASSHRRSVCQVMAYEACRDVMEALRTKYSGPLQV